MNETRPLISPTMDIDWSRRSKSLNRCLLFAAVLLASFGIVSLLTQADAQLRAWFSSSTVFVAGAIWLLAAYLFSRWHRFLVSGWMLVLFALAAIGLLLYSIPNYTISLLPAAVLPVALALLLLNRRSVVVVTALTVALLLVTGLVMPVGAPVVAALPITPIELAVGVSAASTALLALILLPLRSAYIVLMNQLKERDATHERVMLERQVIERDRDAALQLAAKHRQLLDVLVQHIQDGVLSVNEHGQVVRANMIGRELWAAVGAGDITGQSLTQVQSALGSDGEAQQADLVALSSSGLAPEEAYTHVLVDRRERARLARLRGELLGLLTEEMRNPLTSMVTALDLTLGQSHLPEDVDRVLLGARQSGHRLLELVTTLLEISQIEQNPKILRRSSSALARVLEAGIYQMGPLAQRGAVTVTIEHAGDSTVSIDSDRIQRAFTYILEQAIRRSPPYSTVQVRTERQEGQVIVLVADQGPGLSAQQRDMMFRQRVLADERGAPALGLNLSKLVIEAHDGRVWVESNGSQGNTYGFALPAELPELVEKV